MKKIYFKVFQLKNLLINSVIILMLAIVSMVAFAPENPTQMASVINGAYYRGDEEKGAVSLMINVYWGTEYIPQMLETLKQKQVKATFFIGGMWAVDNEDLLKDIHTQGHEIANHGYKHKSQENLSFEDAKTEFTLTHDLIKRILDIDMNLFAPPSGSYNNQTIQIANSLNYSTIMWSKDTIDWRDQQQEVITERATKSSSNGELILMHPTAATAQALPAIIDKLFAENLKILPVGQHITPQNKPL